MMPEHGWFQVAFTRDITQEITPISLGQRELIIIRTESAYTTYDAFCPHRGAHLGHSGCREGSHIRCKFHDYLIGLGAEKNSRFQLKSYLTREVGGLLFVRLCDQYDTGFSDRLNALVMDHCFVAGFELEVKAPFQLIVENAFDSSHFHSVHRILNHPEFSIGGSVAGEYRVDGEFVVPRSCWHVNSPAEGDLTVPFSATAYSPGIVIGAMQGDDPYKVVTCATPLTAERCLVRLSLAIPQCPEGQPPEADMCRYLLEKSYAGLQQDKQIWENMNHYFMPVYLAQDASVLGFQSFCAHFDAE